VLKNMTDLMEEYEKELRADADMRERRASTPGTVEHFFKSKADIERKKTAEAFVSADLSLGFDDTDDDDECDDE